MADLPLTLGELKARVRALLQWTRDADDTELRDAINFGYGKGIKAVLATRSESFMSYVEPFTLSAGVSEYDVGIYDPPIFRPIRLLVGEGSAANEAFFRYKSIVDAEYQEADAETSGSGLLFLYDFLTGLLPGTTAIVQNAVTGSVTVDALGSIVQGSLISVPGCGPAQAVGAETVPSIYRGIVTQITGLTLSVEPDFTVVPAAATVVTQLRRRVMKIVPRPSQTLTGRLWYNYRPARLSRDTDMLDMLVAEHEDMIVHYALTQLGWATGDTNANRWYESAQEERSEMMQDLGTVTGQDSAEMGSGLWGVEDW